MQTLPYNIQQYFTAVKMVIFRGKILRFFLFLLKTLIVGRHKNRLIEAVLMSTHNLCFREKKRKKCIPLYTQVSLYKSGV